MEAEQEIAEQEIDVTLFNLESGVGNTTGMLVDYTTDRCLFEETSEV
jgi:hypothetical protein